ALRELAAREGHGLHRGALGRRQHGDRVEAERAGNLGRAEHRAGKGAHCVVESRASHARRLSLRSGTANVNGADRMTCRGLVSQTSTLLPTLWPTGRASTLAGWVSESFNRSG